MSAHGGSYGGEGLNPSNIQVDRLFDALSTASEQNPTGLGVTNSKLVEFGSAQGSPVEDFMLDVNGRLTINTSGTYRIKIALQFGRSGSAGTSVLLFRVKVNGVQAGRSVVAKLTNANTIHYFENDNWVNIPAGTFIEFELMRDLSGHNSGGLVSLAPTNEGGLTWQTAPTAALRVERWV